MEAERSAGLPRRVPEELRQLLEAAHLERDAIGMSRAAIYRVSGLPQWGTAYLKVEECTEEDDLLREKQVLEWLRGRLPVPQVLYFDELDGTQFLLISEIAGLHAAAEEHFVSEAAITAMIRALARGLRRVHALDFRECPFRRDLDVVLAEAQERVERGLVDSSELERENMGRDPREILQELQDTRPAAEDLVFTHGDYCLPNIILQGDKISGFVDWGRGGVADRYTDIALAVRSLRYNLAGRADLDLIRIFLGEYGLSPADEAKIDYYILLDELS
jgi:aminoglycoside phosphotransferase